MDNGEVIYLKNTVGSVECFLRFVAMDLKILWLLSQMYIFSAIFSSFDARLDRVDGRT